MGIQSFFHKIKMGIVRAGASSIPRPSEAKRYGNCGEDVFVDMLRRELPDCELKRNVVISTPDGNAEIDCLVLYKNKLFAIEVKRWKGRLTELENGFIQEKTDRWTGEIHTKRMQSPFQQLGRAISLLRKKIPTKAWINAVVFFEDAELELVQTTPDRVWFCHIRELVEYICNSGKETYGSGAKDFFRQCVAADYLYANAWGKSLHCVINRPLLQSIIPPVPVTCIASIHIDHHWSYDELYFHMMNGEEIACRIENAQIQVTENGQIRNYGLCKLDYIEFGRTLNQ